MNTYIKTSESNLRRKLWRNLNVMKYQKHIFDVMFDVM